MESNEKIGKLLEKQRLERLAEKERMAGVNKEKNIGDVPVVSGVDLSEKWGVKWGEFADDNNHLETTEIADFKSPGEVGVFDDLPGVIKEIRDDQVEELAIAIALKGAEADRSTFLVNGAQRFGVVLLVDPRIAARAGELAAARLQALAGLVPEAYRAALTDVSEEIGAKNIRAAMARDLATRLGWKAPAKGGGGGDDDWRAQRRAQRKAAESRWSGKSE